MTPRTLSFLSVRMYLTVDKEKVFLNAGIKVREEGVMELEGRRKKVARKEMGTTGSTGKEKATVDR